MAAASFVLLAVGVAGALARPRGAPAWAVPTAAAIVALASGSTHVADAGHSLRTLASPVGFLLAAVPLAVMLDRVGFFSSVAAAVASRRGQSGALWVLGALTTTVLNLDAGVVLLTPLYAGIGARSGVGRLRLAWQPVLLALLASSALPVSNLTNLIAAARWGLGTVQVAEHLGPPSLAACIVGWLMYRRVVGAPTPVGGPPPDRQRDGLLLGSVVVAGVLVGFTGGEVMGVPPWAVAVAADAVLVVASRSLPTRAVPVGTALVVAALAVLAAGVAPHLPLAHWVSGEGLLPTARSAGVAALAANAMDNLPALLVAVPATTHVAGCSASWGALLGVNMGPSLVVTGTLASLLWQDSLRRMGVDVSASRFSAVAAAVCLPAFAVAVATLLGVQWMLGCG
ncbi:MAG TPA: SLC13 family permease [Acidimicrobiales bacterium]|nr:SLC13 family permease [Acidimicrobiales bacterium]